MAVKLGKEVASSQLANISVCEVSIRQLALLSILIHYLQATRVAARSLDLDCSSLIRLHVKAKQNISPVTSENRFHCVNPLLIFV